jgi:hypothetical protein
MGIDTIYILGHVIFSDLIDLVCEDITDIYHKVRTRIAKRKLHFKDGTSKSADTYIVILQREGSSLYIP